MSGHSARVGTLAWKRHVLSSGSRDSTIIQHDVRMPNHKVATFAGHEQEVRTKKKEKMTRQASIARHAGFYFW